MIRFVVYALFFSFLFINCKNSNKKEKKTIVISTKKVVKRKKDKQQLPKINPIITKDSVVEKLTEYGNNNLETVLDIYTTKGKIRVRLYNDTPLHRASFLLMAKKGYFKHSVFTRVAPYFIAQGGGTYTKEQTAVSRETGVYRIPSEFKRYRIHKQGALAAAREYKNNPDKKSDPFAFYFVEGTLYNTPTLDRYEKENNYKFSKKQRDYYLTNPGAAHLDGQHTVFGEIISGYATIPKITQVERDSKDWPIKDIFIDSVRVVR